jgi:hypothetical protein
MPLQLPVLDDRNFDQLLDEAKRRIPAYTPEWTNFGVESDPGITLVQLFAFLADTLLYRANRIPDRNRLKFLQLLGIPLQPAAAAEGIISIRNDRGPLSDLPLNSGIVVSAGNVSYLTVDGVNVLPLDAQVYYKLPVKETDPLFTDYKTRYEAVLAAQQAELDAPSASQDAPSASQDASSASQDASSASQDASSASQDASGSPSASATVTPAFYQTTSMPVPTATNPSPVVDLVKDAIDRAIYIALLAPKGMDKDEVRGVIANQTLSIGVVPALSGDIPPLMPLQPASRPVPQTNLIFERANVQPGAPAAGYTQLPVLLGPDVLTGTGVVKVQLPGVEGLQAWSFPDPMEEGTGDFPPRLEDQQVAERLVTWIRFRLPASKPNAPDGTTSARLTWVGIHATRIVQAVSVFNEYLGTGTGEPEQAVTLANTPVIADSVTLTVQDVNGVDEPWLKTDDLLSAREGDQVFTLDPEAGLISFGDGLHGTRPQAGERILASYRYGGGLQGNVGIGAVKSSRDLRLQGGYKIENPVPTSGGDVGETVADAERNIPLFLAHRDRLVTQQDFQTVTLRTPGVDVGRVEVLPLFRPGLPAQDPADGVVTVMVIPQSDPLNPLWPTPDRSFLQRVCDYLDSRRLVTTEIYVRGPEYVAVYVSVGIQVQGGFFADVVRQEVQDRLKGYLSSLPPGGPDGKGWPLKKKLIQKDLEAVITRVPGVDFVDSIQMGVESMTDVPDYNLSGLTLPRLAGISVIEGSAEPLSSVFGSVAQPSEPGTQVVPIPVCKCTC